MSFTYDDIRDRFYEIFIEEFQHGWTITFHGHFPDGGTGETKYGYAILTPTGLSFDDDNADPEDSSHLFKTPEAAMEALFRLTQTSDNDIDTAQAFRDHILDEYDSRGNIYI